MSGIDISKWQKFRICDLFYTEKIGNTLQTPTGASVKKTDLTEGAVPRITVKGINNGILGYYDAVKANPNYRVYENFISVSFLGTVFYHQGKASLDMKVHCLKLKDYALNKYTGLFLATCIKKSLKESRYSDQISSTVLPRLVINLPVNEEGKPNFSYMEQYMKNLEISANSCLNKLQSANNLTAFSNINVTDWGYFSINSLFKVVRPAPRSQLSYLTGNVPFVASGNYNNGVIKYVLPKKEEALNEGNCISISPIDGSTFYQSVDFLGRGGAGSSIILLYNEKLNKYNGLFLAAIIQKFCRKYIYNDMANKGTISNEVIKLPVDKAGKPDFLYMEKYMKNLEKRVKNNIEILKKIT